MVHDDACKPVREGVFEFRGVHLGCYVLTCDGGFVGYVKVYEDEPEHAFSDGAVLRKRSTLRHGDPDDALVGATAYGMQLVQELLKPSDFDAI